MKRHASVIGPHTGLWMLMLGAGVLAVLLACVGTAAGATRVVAGDGGEGVDYASMQTGRWWHDPLAAGGGGCWC